jgi:hypothetical protein
MTIEMPLRTSKKRKRLVGCMKEILLIDGLNIGGASLLNLSS